MKVALAICVAVVLHGAADTARADQAESWMPLAVGSQWSYDSVTDSDIRLADYVQSSKMAGETVIRVEKLRDASSGVRVVTTDIHNETQAGSKSRALRTDHLGYANGSLLWYGNGLKQAGLFMHAGDFDTFDPPQVLLEAPLAQGSSWQVGRVEGKAVATGTGNETQSAEVEGRESVETPAGRFDDCLRVHYRTSSDLRVPASPGQGEGGGGAREERTEWYARGVGVVKRLAVTTLKAHRPDGIDVTITSTSTETLRSYQLGAR